MWLQEEKTKNYQWPNKKQRLDYKTDSHESQKPAGV